MCDDEELASLVKTGARRFAAPADLAPAIRAALARETAAAPAPRRPGRWQGWLQLGAAFACGLLASVLLIRFMPMDREGLAEEVVSAHVRSLMVAHLEDVASTDQHTVKPWFAGKLDFSPPVSDFAARGFALTGGRLDYLHGHAVAALVYHHQRHAINVFVWPLHGAEPASSLSSSRDGYNLIAWQGGGMQFWAVSDLNAAELAQFADLLRGGAAP